MPNEHSGISRRRLLRTASVGVPAAGVLALGSSIVSIPAAQSLEADGYWGSETTSQLQKFFFNIFAQELGQPTYGYEDGVVKYQPASQQSANPGLGSGWQWESDGERKATTSPSITCSVGWAVLRLTARLAPIPSKPCKITTVSRQMVAWMDLRRLSRLCRTRLVSTSVSSM